MFKKLLFSLLLLFLALASQARDQLKGVNPDSLTLKLYQQGRWEALLQQGRLMNRQGIDYYYLRMRMAVAAFETARYDDAATHLQKALKFSPRDFQARRLLALARQYSLMPAEAGKVFSSLPENQRQSLNFKTGFNLLSAHADVGLNQTNLKLAKRFETLSGKARLYGSQTGLHSTGIIDAGLWMQLAPAWLFYGGVQRLEHNFQSNFAYLEPELNVDRIVLNGNFKDYYYRLDSKPIVRNSTAAVQQNNAFMQLRHALSHRLQLVASAGISKVYGEYLFAKTDTLHFSDTARLDLSTGQATLFGVDIPVARFGYEIWRTTDYRLALGGIAHFGRISPMAGLHWGRVNDTTHFQLQAGYNWRPWGNAGTWQQAEVFLLQTGGTWRPVAKIAAGHWFGLKTYVNATLLFGHLNGMADQWGYLTFNYRDKTNLFGEAALMQQINSHLFLNLRYRFVESTMRIEQLDQDFKLSVFTKTIFSHGFIGGVIWNF